MAKSKTTVLEFKVEIICLHCGHTWPLPLTEACPSCQHPLTTVGIDYLRVSSDDQANNFSIPTQRTACRRYGVENQVDALIECTDDGYSGTTLERPVLDRARSILRQRHIDIFVAHDVDRLSRTLVDLMCLDKEFELNGVKLDFVTYPNDASPEGKLFLQIKGAFSEYERSKLRERARRGRIGRAEAGVPYWGFMPYGYRYIGADVLGKHHARWEIIEGEAQVIREMFRWLIEDGLSIREITRRFYEKGIRTHSGAIFNRSVVRDILTNQVYTGISYFNKTQKQKKGAALKRDESEHIMILVPRIIEPKVLEKAKEQLAANRYRCVKENDRQYLLTGFLFCPCGRRMSGKPSNGYRYYQCVGRGDTLADPCTIKGYVNADRAEAWVWGRNMEALQEDWLMEQELNKGQAEVQDATANQSYEIDIKRAVLKDLERKNRRADEAYCGDAIDLAEYNAKKDVLRQQEQELLKDIAELETRIASQELGQKKLLQLQEAVVRRRAKLVDADFAHKVLALEALELRVTAIEPNFLEITGKIVCEVSGDLSEVAGGSLLLRPV